MEISKHDPRAPKPLTRRGVLITLAVLVSAMLMTAASVYLRRPKLERTRAFLGSPETEALQLGTIFEIAVPGTEWHATNPNAAQSSELAWVDLSDSPGLSMFRRALLDERHYRWPTQQEASVAALEVANPEYVVIRVSGEIPNTPTSQQRELGRELFLIEMSEGWMGKLDGPGAVQFTDRVRPAVRNFVMTRKDAAKQHLP